MRYLRTFSRIFLGILFVFSGFVKALDPLGSAYKFGDYFHAFGIGSLDVLSLPLGIFLAAFELVLGLILLLGYQKRIIYIILLWFMSFFTVLTFILALTNPVSDCGCFGDAIKLTNWETFFKNILFMVFVLILYKERKKSRNVHSNPMEWLIISVFFLLSFGLSGYCLNHLPVLDFRPYDVGTNISEDMKIPEGESTDEYSTTLIYLNKETGKEEKFKLENYPTDTALYSFVTSESKLIKKGYEPPIHDFGILDPEGYDVSDQLLEFSGYTLLMTSPDLKKANQDALLASKYWEKLTWLTEDLKFVPVTSSAGTDKTDVIAELGLEFPFYSGDEIMLKTMVRSNPGFMLLKNGNIVAKWSYKDMQEPGEWNKDWNDMMNEYDDSMGPEIESLINEGLIDPIQWDILDFDMTASKIVSLRQSIKSDKMTWMIYAMAIIIIILILRFIPGKKVTDRV